MKRQYTPMQSQALSNRLAKNLKKLGPYLKKEKLEAYRLYKKDIPEYPYLIDIYGERAVIYEQGKRLGEEDELKRRTHQQEISAAITAVTGVPAKLQYWKIRERQKGTDQYVPLQSEFGEFFEVAEPPFKFLVNLERYLDTGLFLDHRPLRKHLSEVTKGKKVLNLFCYTGSLSVAAAKGGGSVTSVDMSRTYLDWALENFLINGLSPNDHVFSQADVLKDLKRRIEVKESWDLILLDPPSFSNSKRMEEDLDVERDHPILVRDCMQLLSPTGTLYFSTNRRRFDLHPIITQTYQVKEISHWTVPQDFHHSEIHRAYMLTHKSRS